MTNNMNYKNDIPRVLNMYNEYRSESDEYVSIDNVMKMNPNKFQGDFYKNLHQHLTDEGLKRQAQSIKTQNAIFKTMQGKIDCPYFSNAFALDVLKCMKQKNEFHLHITFKFNNDHEVVLQQPMFNHSLTLDDYETMKALGMYFMFGYQLDKHGAMEYQFLLYANSPIHNTAFMLRFETDDMNELFKKCYQKYPDYYDDDDDESDYESDDDDDESDYDDDDDEE